VITAVGGLVVGLHEPKPAADKQLVAQTTSGSAGSGSVAAATGPRATPAVASPVGARSAVVLSAAGAPAVTASLNQVKVGNTVVKILSARLDPASQNSFDLRLATRVTNEATYAGYWGSNCCRLIIDDVPRAPSDFKPLTVEAQAAMDGEMTFSVPNGTTEADLRLIAGDKDTRIHLQFAAPK
jgi:hypothetical protein